jgi:hypothetical protein
MKRTPAFFLFALALFAAACGDETTLDTPTDAIKGVCYATGVPESPVVFRPCEEGAELDDDGECTTRVFFVDGPVKVPADEATFCRACYVGVFSSAEEINAACVDYDLPEVE